MSLTTFLVRLVHHICRAAVLLYATLVAAEWLIPGLVLPFADLVDWIWLILALIALSVALPLDKDKVAA